MEYNLNLQYCYNDESTTDWVNHVTAGSHINTNRLRVDELYDVICIPDQDKLGECFRGGIFKCDGQPVVESFQRDGLQYSDLLWKSFEPRKVIFEDRKVVYLGQYRRHWGSFLCDSISRLWFTLDNPKDYMFAYMGTQVSLGGVDSLAYEFLELLGIDSNQIIYVTKPTKFKELILPEASYRPLIDYHEEYIDIIDKAIRAVSCDPQNYIHEKLYFSRTKYTKNSKIDYGENEIVRLLKSNGFYIAFPEDYNVKERIMLMNNCKVFASTGGCNSLNIILSKTRPKTIIFNRMNGYQFLQWFFNEMANVEPITYIDSYCEPYKKIFETTIAGPYLYYVNKNVRRFARDNEFKLNVHDYVSFERIKNFVCYSFRCLYTMLSRLKHKILDK